MERENAGIPSAANAKHGKPRHRAPGDSTDRYLAAERIERLNAQQAEHDLGFAFRTPAQRERGQAGAPGGSGLASWAARFDSSGSVIGFIGFRVYCPVSKEIGGDI